MKWMIYFIAGWFVIVAAIALVGALLPRDHVATRRVKLGKPAEEVFALISGPQDWRTDVAKWERIDEAHFLETAKNGGKMRMRVIESNPPLRRVTRIDDDSLPFGGTWTWQLTPIPGGGGCEARVTENGFVGNVIFRALARFVFGHHATMETYLKNLGAKLGEPNVKLEE